MSCSSLMRYFGVYRSESLRRALPIYRKVTTTIYFSYFLLYIILNYLDKFLIKRIGLNNSKGESIMKESTFSRIKRRFLKKKVIIFDRLTRTSKFLKDTKFARSYNFMITVLVHRLKVAIMLKRWKIEKSWKDFKKGLYR